MNIPLDELDYRILRIVIRTPVDIEDLWMTLIVTCHRGVGGFLDCNREVEILAVEKPAVTFTG